MKLLIYKILKERELTPYQLAKKTGMNVNIFYDLKSGKQKDITLSKAYKIAKALNVSIDDLIEEDINNEYK